MRILMSAYQCGPGMGSVSQIGWEWYSRMSRRASITLVTHVRNRESLTKAGAPLADSEVIYVDTEWFAGPLYRMASRMFPRSEHARFLVSSIDFFVYDAAALKLLRKRRAEWDVVHAVTPVSPIAATRLHGLGLPLIVGPWNGGLTSPSTFPEIMSEDSVWVYRLRWMGVVLDRLFGCTRRASMILSATRSTDASLPEYATARRMIENGVDLDLFHPGSWDPAPSASDPVRVLFVGRLIPAKGISMLLEAVSRLSGELPLAVTIVGDGPSRDSIRKEVADRNLEGTVHLAGNRPLAEVAKLMRNAHVFCLPSVRESGGAVLLESMACGVPVIAVNYGGPAEIVDAEVGWTLSAEGREALVGDLVEAFRDLARNPGAWKAKGRQGRLRAEKNYGWDARMDAALSIYRQFAGGKAAHA
jgi:glycosyltransferase involved in cell wall biosynthesis